MNISQHSFAAHPQRILGAISITANVAFAIGCAQDLSEQSESSEDGHDVPGAITLDVSDHERYIYYDLDASQTVAPDDPQSDENWDLAASRYRIKTNGGISGSSMVIVARLEKIDFESITNAPEGEYLQDEADGSDEDEDEDLAFLVNEGWYAYNERDHSLTPQPVVYVLRSTAERYYKVQVLDYYDDVGESGELTFRYAPIAAPDSEPMAVTTRKSVKDDQSDQPQSSTSDESTAADDTPDKGASEESDGGTASSDAAPGCYDMTSHACDCDTDEAACMADQHIWTPQCDCEGSAPVQTGM